MSTLIKCLAASLVLIFAASSSVQSQDDYNRWEIMGGYSYMNLNRGIDPDEFDDDFSDTPQNRVNAHGFNGSVTYNFTRFIGAKFDLTLHSHGEDFDSVLAVNPLFTPGPGTFKVSQNVYQYMGGVQIKDNTKEGSRFRPFGHVLVGVADQDFTIERTQPFNEIIIDANSTDFAMKFGGGVDFRVHKNLSIRAIQFDWNPIVRGDLDTNTQFGEIESVLQNNWLLTFGGVVHF